MSLKQIDYLEKELNRLFDLESISDKITFLNKTFNDCDYLIIKHNELNNIIIVKNHMANNVKYHKDLCNVFNSFYADIDFNNIDFNNQEQIKKFKNFDFNNTTIIGTSYEILSFIEENIQN